MADSRTVIGLEIEYAVSGILASGERVDPGSASVALLRELKRQHVWLPTTPEGESVFFAFTGGRAYIDCGGHLEICTGEVNTPHELVLQILAIHLALVRAIDQLAESDGIRITVTQTNVDYLTGATFGNHFNILTKGEFLRDTTRSAGAYFGFQASRVVFGGGGFDFETGAFVLCPRSLKITTEISEDSTGTSRPLYHNRGRCDPLSKGGGRIHDISMGGLMNPVANQLRIGASTLVGCLIDRGASVSDSMRLKDPVRALHRWAQDISLSVQAESVNGNRYTAVEMQRLYLEFCTNNLQLCPEYAPETLSMWAETLDLLEADGGKAENAVLIKRLDWPSKLFTYRRYIQTSGLQWEEYFDEIRKKPKPAVVKPIQEFLFLLDIKYSDICSPGWGQINFLEVPDIDIDLRAIESVYDGSLIESVRTRARPRARQIRQHGSTSGSSTGKVYVSNWSTLLDFRKKRQKLSLSDPLEYRIRGENVPQWSDFPESEERRSRYGRRRSLVRDTLARLAEQADGD